MDLKRGIDLAVGEVVTSHRELISRGQAVTLPPDPMRIL